MPGNRHPTFHTSIASEFRDKVCNCHAPLFFIHQSLKTQTANHVQITK